MVGAPRNQTSSGSFRKDDKLHYGSGNVETTAGALDSLGGRLLALEAEAIR